MDKNMKEVTQREENKDITRKDALKKVGKYAAVTATAMFVVLSPKESQASSPSTDTCSPPTPDWPPTPATG